MDTKKFTEHLEILKIVSNIEKDIKGKIFSDVVDTNGNQYVDLVQEGGGVLGIALLGYTYILERAGIRFFSLAGTSAGAINTIVLSALDNIDNPKSERILSIIANKNLFEFVDGPFFIKLLLKMIGSKVPDQSIILKFFSIVFIALWIVVWLIPIIIYFFIKKGLNPGKSFTNWLTEILHSNNINSTSDLNLLRQRPQTIKIRDGVNRDILDLIPKLKIITAEITTETRVIFPEMNCLFWDKPDKVNPAEYVRASMSIPIFFHPFTVKTGLNIDKAKWKSEVKYDGKIPEKSFFVDGGVLSNFPIDVFHNSKIIPRLPTFGVKLGYDRNNLSNVNSVIRFLFAIFNSARHVLDYQFLLKNRDYENLITRIDVDGFNWLNFSISDDNKIELFIRGAKAAEKFLREFDWINYKRIREDIITV